MRKWRQVITFLMCVSYLSAQQSIRFKSLGVNDGLSQSTVTQIIQDHHGFIWLGTQDGLNRFDGYQFKVFRNNEGDSTSLSNNYIMSLACDAQGNVWIGTTNGLNRIDARSGKLTRIYIKHLLKGATNFRINTICADEQAGVYVSTAFGTLFVDESGTAAVIPEFEKNKIGGLSALVLNEKRLFFSTETTLFQFDLKTRKLSQVLQGQGVMQILSVKANRLIYKNDAGLYAYDLDLKTEKKIFEKYLQASAKPNVQAVLQLDQEEWICTESALLWRKNQDTFLIRHNENLEKSISSDFVYCALRDFTGNYWFGTSRGGVNVFRPSLQDIKLLGKAMGVNEAVWSSAEFGDTLILATSRGIKCFSKKQKGVALSAVFIPELALQEIQIPKLQLPLKDVLVTSVCSDQSGRVWLSTEREGIAIYDLKKGQLISIRHSITDSTSIVSDRVIQICRLSDTAIGLCSAYGFCWINPQTLKSKRLYLSQYMPGQINYIMKAYQEQDNLWLSTAKGLCRFNVKTKKLDQYLPDSKNIEEQYHNIVSDAKPAANGQNWLSTMGFGLHLLDPLSGETRHFGNNVGLVNENLLGLLIDAKNRVWAGSHDGISCFDPETELFTNYGINEGLDSKECTVNGFYKAHDGDLYFGTVTGLVIFDPLRLRPDTNIGGTVLTGIKVNYENYVDSKYVNLQGSYYRPTHITIDENVRTISFEFAALHFAEAEDLKYRYQLKGFNNTWAETSGNERLAAYTSLPPGTYTFALMPVLNGRPLYSKALTFILKVVPPFWKTMWFMILSTSVILFSVVFTMNWFYQRKIKRQKEKAEDEMRMQKEKERISRELHDNVGSQLTYIIKSIDTLSYKSEQQNDNVVQDLDALGNFSRETLSQLRESIWAINSQKITLEELVSKIQDYVNKISANLEDLEIECIVELVSNCELKPSFAINCFRIVQEAIVNSVKYSGSKKISITFTQTNDESLIVIVSDNGKGFDANLRKEGSYGLSNMQSRAVEVGARLVIESILLKGTTVSLETDVEQYGK